MRQNTGTEPNPLVSATDIGVSRGGRWIFRHVDLQVAKGDLVSIVGANGAGKTTCLKAVLGLIDCNEGSVWRLPGLVVGYVPQRLAVNPTLPFTVRRMVNLVGHFSEAEIDATLKAVGLGRLGNPQISTLSGGELQRLLLARALIHNPDLLVLDEPNQGVDVTGSDVLQGLVDRIRSELNCGVLMVSHDLSIAADIASDVVVLIPHEHDNPTCHQQLAPDVHSGSPADLEH